MKHLIPMLALTAAVPAPAAAQLSVVLEGSQPVVRANVGLMTISAKLGGRGIDWHIDDRATTSSGRTPGRTAPTTRRASARASSVLATADEYVGTPYLWGGETPSGFDCSGFVQYVFRAHGIELPRTSRQQAQVGERIAPTLSELEPGDLMFFATDGVHIDHVAIFVGDNEIIQSSSSGGGVGYDQLNTKRGRWFATHHVATRRVIADGGSLVAPLTAALRAFAHFDPPDHAPRRN